MTNHTAARKTLISSLESEGPDSFVYSRSTMREIAALIEEQDAQISVLREIVSCIFAELNSGDDSPSYYFIDIKAEKLDEAARALANTAQAAADHDARIRANERERCVKIIDEEISRLSREINNTALWEPKTIGLFNSQRECATNLATCIRAIRDE